jgi:NNP family nitrate/nitrite transporter-like MFS transporter
MILGGISSGLVDFNPRRMAAIMSLPAKAARIRLRDFSSPQMRAFHMSWIAFFLCFFAWFAIAPLMKVVRDELHLTQDQIGWCIVGSVALTVVARLFVGWLCDRVGPRIAYSALMIVGSLPVMGVGLAHDYTTFLAFRVAIGIIGASFVITQYHTTQMFASNCVGTANAMTAGWGNFGGGVTHLAMPLLFAFFCVTLGLAPAASWRVAMVVVGGVCMAAGVIYFLLTQDTPAGNYRELRAAGVLPTCQAVKGTFQLACRDYRVWSLSVAYALCFGVELTIDNVAALYFLDYFDELKQMDIERALGIAGLCASVFGGMAIFARALGGYIADQCGEQGGFAGRAKWLFLTLFCEGVLLMLFGRMRTLATAIPVLLLCGLFVHMAAGATYAVVPFVHRRALGSVAGIVGAGGNVGAVLSGFLFTIEGVPWTSAFFVLGAAVTAGAFSCLTLSEPVWVDEPAMGRRRLAGRQSLEYAS